MARYIDADKLKPKTEWWLEMDDYDHEREYRRSYYPLSEIENAPTEEVQPIIYGKWECICSLQSWQFVHEHYKCSVCNGEVEYESKYCPNCGAIMNENEEE